MNPKLAVKGINGIIEGGISITDFSVVTELDEISAKELLYTLVQNGIGSWNDDLVDFDIPHDRLQTALFAITLGATIEDVSEYLTWRDFEAITGIILEENGFTFFRIKGDKATAEIISCGGHNPELQESGSIISNKRVEI